MLLDITAALVFEFRALLPAYLHMYKKHARISRCVVRQVMYLRRLERFLGLPVVQMPEQRFELFVSGLLLAFADLKLRRQLLAVD